MATPSASIWWFFAFLIQYHKQEKPTITNVRLWKAFLWLLGLQWQFVKLFTLPMLRLLSSKAQGRKYFWKPSTPCHVGIHWKAVAEYCQISTHIAGFQSFCRFFFTSIYIGQMSHQQHKGVSLISSLVAFFQYKLLHAVSTPLSLTLEKNGYVARDQLLYAL